MIRRYETDPVDGDERLGEAIEAFLALAESGSPPDADEFAARYPDIGEDLRAALEGLALVRGLVGDSSGPGHRLEAGRRVAGYRIVRELGRGGMGIVYEAVHVDLDRPVALKVLGTHAAPDSIGRRRFLNEARTAAGLHHTHIVPVFDVGQVGGLCYYAMQRIEGCGLDRVLKAMRRDRTTAAGSGAGGSWSAPTAQAPQPGAGDLSGLASHPAISISRTEETASWRPGQGAAGAASSAPNGLVRGSDDDETPLFVPPRGSAYYRWVAEVGRRAAEALAHAHSRGIIHRDVKPSNLLVDCQGSVWVADFGLARRLADPGLTQSDSRLGTPRYMSPEQVESDSVDSRSDVYSLGATLYELLTLRPPFDGRSTVELHRQIVSREPVPPSGIDPRIPRDLETIVLKAMAKRPADRYATASELADDLLRFLGHEPVRARRIGVLGRVWRFARRHPGISTVSTVAAATVLAVATFAYVRVVHERDLAIRAQGEMSVAWLKEERAKKDALAAMRSQLLSQASLTRLSSMPRRRDQGFELIKQAVAYGADANLRYKLRNEAAEFLAIHDIEPRKLELNVGRTRGIAFGADPHQLASLSEDGSELHFWNLDQSSPLSGPAPAQNEGSEGAAPGNNNSSSPPSGGPGGGRRNGALTQVGARYLAAALPDGKGVRLFDSATGAQVRDLAMPDYELAPAFGTPVLGAPGNERRLVTISVNRPASAAIKGLVKGPGPFRFQVNLWDTDHADRPLAVLVESRPGESGRPGPRPSMVAIAPDGETVATAQPMDTIITLWSMSDGKQIRQIDTQAQLSAIALGPDGLLAAAGGGAVRLWQIEPLATLPSITPRQNFVQRLRFSPDGTLLAVSGSETGVEVWDPAGNALVAALPTADRGADVAFSTDGRTLAIAHGSTVGLWNVLKPQGLVHFSEFREMLTSLAFGPDGQLAMAAAWGGGLRLWRPSHCPSTCREWDDVAASAVAFDQQGCLVGVDPDALRFYQPPDHTCIRQVSLPESHSPFDRERERGRDGERAGGSRSGRGGFRPFAVGRTADGSALALARSAEVLLCPLDGRNEESIRRLTIPFSQMSLRPSNKGRGGMPGPGIWRDVAIGPGADRVYLLSPSPFGNVVSMWDVQGDELVRLEWPVPHEATCMALSPDGLTLALGDRAGGVVLIDTKRGEVRNRLASPSEEDEGEVRSLAFSPIGRELAVGTQRGSIHLWNVRSTPEPILRLPAHRGAVNILAYDTEGQRLASGGFDRAVVVWDFSRVRTELTSLGLDW